MAKFPVPFLDPTSCFYTKLLANADRMLIEPFKDIFDILAMYKVWGDIPEAAITYAESHYGQKVVIPNLIKAVADIINKPKAYEAAAHHVRMKDVWRQELIYRYAPQLLFQLKKRQI